MERHPSILPVDLQEPHGEKIHPVRESGKSASIGTTITLLAALFANESRGQEKTATEQANTAPVAVSSLIPASAESLGDRERMEPHEAIEYMKTVSLFAPLLHREQAEDLLALMTEYNHALDEGYQPDGAEMGDAHYLSLNGFIVSADASIPDELRRDFHLARIEWKRRILQCLQDPAFQNDEGRYRAENLSINLLEMRAHTDDPELIRAAAQAFVDAKFEGDGPLSLDEYMDMIKPFKTDHEMHCYVVQKTAGRLRLEEPAFAAADGDQEAFTNHMSEQISRAQRLLWILSFFSEASQAENCRESYDHLQQQIHTYALTPNLPLTRKHLTRTSTRDILIGTGRNLGYAVSLEQGLLPLSQTLQGIDLRENSLITAFPAAMKENDFQSPALEGKPFARMLLQLILVAEGHEKAPEIFMTDKERSLPSHLQQRVSEELRRTASMAVLAALPALLEDKNGNQALTLMRHAYNGMWDELSTGALAKANPRMTAARFGLFMASEPGKVQMPPDEWMTKKAQMLTPFLRTGIPRKSIPDLGTQLVQASANTSFASNDAEEFRELMLREIFAQAPEVAMRRDIWGTIWNFDRVEAERAALAAGVEWDAEK